MSEALLAQSGAVLLMVCGAATVLQGGLRSRGLGVLLASGVVTTALALAVRWLDSGQGPFLTLYEVVMSNVFSLALISALAYARWPLLRLGASFTLGVVALLALWTLFLPRAHTPLPPTFDNPWLWAHVLSGKGFLGLYLVATGLAVRLLMTRPHESQAREMDAQVWRFAALAFVFDTLMLVTGAVWANDAWGRYWAWDPLESSAFLTWLALALLLHLRLALRLPAPVQWAMASGVFVLAFLTFFGMPFLSLGAHRGIL